MAIGGKSAYKGVGFVDLLDEVGPALFKLLRDEWRGNLRDLGRFLVGTADKPAHDVISRLMAFRGVGHLISEWFLARALGRPRVVAGDLRVRKAVAATYLNGRLPSEREVRTITAHWGDAACVAQQLLLHALSNSV
ncbi:MAG: hypothetical protein O7B35_11875 [Deltaproteobacteria bacterium]|nr:hypothetical protein [Deltaproteobacteria bacterium]